MEREKIIKKFVSATGLALMSVSLSGAANIETAQGLTPYQYRPYEGPLTQVVPLETTRPIQKRVPDNNISAERNADMNVVNRDNSPGITQPIDIFSSHTDNQSKTVIPLKSTPELIAIPEINKKPKTTPAEVFASDWSLDPNISFYGPGFYGKRTACGFKLTKELIGVASRTLSCGTKVTFMWNGIQVEAPVVDWGPAEWTGRQFDLTGGACMAFKTPDQPKDHCFSGSIYYKIGK
jgi:hypothetical protein